MERLPGPSWDRVVFGGYARDVVTGEGIAMVTTSLALLVLLAVACRWTRTRTRTWPAVAAGLVAALVVLGSFVHPLVVEPLHDFTPLPDGELRPAIFALADQEGVAVERSWSRMRRGVRPR